MTRVSLTKKIKLSLSPQGCLFHACATCYAGLDDRKHPLTELTMAETRARTLLKERWIDEHYVRAQNYAYVSARECDWNRRVALSLSLRLKIKKNLRSLKDGPRVLPQVKKVRSFL